MQRSLLEQARNHGTCAEDEHAAQTRLWLHHATKWTADEMEPESNHPHGFTQYTNLFWSTTHGKHGSGHLSSIAKLQVVVAPALEIASILSVILCSPTAASETQDKPHAHMSKRAVSINKVTE